MAINNSQHISNPVRLSTPASISQIETESYFLLLHPKARVLFFS